MVIPEIKVSSDYFPTGAAVVVVPAVPGGSPENIRNKDDVQRYMKGYMVFLPLAKTQPLCFGKKCKKSGCVFVNFVKYSR